MDNVIEARVQGEFATNESYWTLDPVHAAKKKRVNNATIALCPPIRVKLAKVPKAPHPDRDEWRRLRRYRRQRYLDERTARAEIDREEWRDIYRAMRCLRGRAIHWLRRAARVPHNQVSDEIWIARQVLAAMSAKPDDALSTCAGPMMRIEYWRTDDWTFLHLFTLVVPHDSPRPIPCDTVRWALGALALYMVGERCNAHYDMRTRRRVDRHVSGTWNRYGCIAHAIPNWERRVEGLIADKLTAMTREYWPEEYAARERQDRRSALRRRLEKQDVKWRTRAWKRQQVVAS